MSREGSERRPTFPGYHLFMLVLCLYTLALLTAQTLLPLSPQTRGVLYYADYAVCLLFFIDFVVSLLFARNRWRYFMTWGWLDLLSSIPVIDTARWGRAARVVRALRVLRALRATQILVALILRRRTENTFLAVSLVALLLVVFCSIAVLHFETHPDANIKTAEDAIWWAFATITTVGYGDRYPVTSEGRLIATILMCAGVGLFGAFSGLVAAWFLGSDTAASERHIRVEIAALREELAQVRRLVEHRNERRGTEQS
jgi:voltage-gated potassium channel